jgi:hypothetical protein
MKKVPSKEDFRTSNTFLGRVSIFQQVKEAYKSVLQNTGDDFMLLRFGKILGRDGLQNTPQINKQFVYLLHLFLKSAATLFTLLTTNAKDNVIWSLPKIGALFFYDHDPSVVKLNGDLLSPELNIDQWTWLLEQWRDMLRTMPIILTQAGAFSRLVRTTIGIGLMHLGKCAETMVITGHQPNNAESMNEQLFCALQIGFYFGIAYAVVDCLQDEVQSLDQIRLHHFLAFDEDKNRSLTSSETVDKWLSITEQWLSGKDFDRNQLPKTPFTSMLTDAFDSLSILTQSVDTTCGSLNELALLLRAQRVDKKEMGQHYEDEQLYIGQLFCMHNHLKEEYKLII